MTVLGVGKVGSDLVRRFLEAGGKVTIADVYPLAIEKLTQRFLPSTSCRARTSTT